MGRNAGRPRGTIPDGDRIREMRLGVGWTQQQLWEASEVSVRKISDAERGMRTSRSTLLRLEEALAVERQRLEGAVITIPGEPADWTENDLAALIARIRSVLETAEEVRVVRVGRGSTKLTVVLTPEDARKLEAAFRDGRLKPLGVLAVETERGRRRAAAQKWRSLASSAVGLLCGLSIFLPVWRVPYFVSGIAFSLAGGTIGRHRRYLILLGVAGLAVNLVTWRGHVAEERKGREAAPLKAEDEEIDRLVAEGLKLRSTVIVLFPLTATEIDKHDFEGPWDEERIKALRKKYVGIGSREAAAITIDGVKEMLGLMGGPKLAEIQPGSEEEQRIKDLQTLILAKADDFVMLAPGFMTHGYDPGRQSFDLTVKKKSIYGGDVYIPKSSNVYCILKRYPNGEIVLDRFIPDITKPQPEVVFTERQAGGHVPIDKSLAPKLVYLINISDYQLDTSGSSAAPYQPVRSAEDFIDGALMDLDELCNGPLGFLYKPSGRDFRQFNDVRDQLLKYKEPNKKFVSNSNVSDSALDTNYLRLSVGGKDVYNGTVFVPAVKKVYCLIDRSPDGTARVVFLPDITKPLPSP